MGDPVQDLALTIFGSIKVGEKHVADRVGRKYTIFCAELLLHGDGK